MRQERQLQGAHGLVFLDCDHKAVPGVTVDLGERIEVGLRQGIGRILSRLTKCVVGVHPNDRQKVSSPRISKRQGGHLWTVPLLVESPLLPARELARRSRVDDGGRP